MVRDPFQGLRSLIGVVLVCGWAGGITAQQAVLYQDAERAFEQMQKAFEQGYYGESSQAADRFLARYPEPGYQCLQDQAILYRFRSDLRLGKPGVLSDILAFVSRRQPTAIAQQALFLVADEAYQAAEYEDAIRYFGMIDERNLEPALRNERNFKTGYCHFVRKEFEESAAYLRKSSDVRDRFYYPSNYYYGMTQYFRENYPDALRSFERVAVSEFFKDHVPYYITQIHFVTGRYKDVIGYGEQALASSTVLNATEIHQLVGRACFETGLYAEAIPHLEVVNAGRLQLQPDDFYQLGMAYYQTGQYARAIQPWLAIRNEPGVKSQYANYYLGRCYLETGDRVSARNALQLAYGRTDDPRLAVEASFHYGRLAAEQGDDVEAIRVLQAIPETSSFYSEAQAALVGILVNTRDYGLAIRELEAMASLTPMLKGAYQKVCLLRAEQLLQDEKPDEAMTLLDKSLMYPVDKGLQARACFWKSEIFFQRGAFTDSDKWLASYFALSPGTLELPVSQRPEVARYTQGYNALRLGKVPEALIAFENCLSGIDSWPEGDRQSPVIRQQVWPDALLRAGDCAFKGNQYERALRHYDRSIQANLPGADYARYQKGLILGLQKKPDEKISTMEALVRDRPDSRWADDALFEIGETRQEQGRSKQAIEAYQRIVDQYGQRSSLLHTALLRMGLIDYNNGQYAEALKHYKRVFEFQPDPETAREALAAIQEIYVTALDRPNDYFTFAESIPGFAVSVSEKDSIQYYAAEDHYAQGEYDRAVASFDQYVVSNPKGAYVAKARFLKAESLSLLKKYPEALAAYEAVVEAGAGPYYAPACRKAAVIAYSDRHDCDKALQLYKAYLPVAGDDKDLRDARIGVMRCAYQTDSRVDLDIVLDDILLDPGSSNDVLASARYYGGTMADKAGDDESALRHYNALIGLNSGEWAAEARYAIAAIYRRQGENELAEKLAEEAARANAGYPVWVARALMLVSDLRSDANDLLNARAILEAILENFTGDAAVRSEAEARLEKVKTEEQRQSRVKPEGGELLDLQPNPKKD